MTLGMTKEKGVACLLVTSVALLSWPEPAGAAEAYYLLVFGSQRTPSNPNYSHSFATYVKATWPDDSLMPTTPRVEAHTISWLPRNMVVRTLALLPECGHNFDLHTTLRWCQDNGMRVSLWGAYQVQPELYDRALRRIAVLHSGKVIYKANDALYRDDVSNCIHALSAIAEGPRLRVLSPGWGEPASFFVLQEFAPWVVGCCRHAWVGSALGLDRYPIIYRDWERPLSGAFFGPVYRALGGERGVVASYGPPAR